MHHFATSIYYQDQFFAVIMRLDDGNEETWTNLQGGDGRWDAVNFDEGTRTDH